MNLSIQFKSLVSVVFNRIALALILDICRTDFATRSIWSKERSSQWWLSIPRTLVDQSWWLNNLRMSRSTFTYICCELSSLISKNSTIMKEPIELKRRAAVTIWRLATNIKYRTLAELFGLGRSTVGKIVLDTCEAIAQHLLQVYGTEHKKGNENNFCRLTLFRG